MRIFKLLPGGKCKEDKENRSTLIFEPLMQGVLIPSYLIYFFEAKCGRVYIRTKCEEYPANTTIGKLEDIVAADFIRCHRSYIANKEMVEFYDKGNNELIMRDGLRVPVSRTYLKQIKAIWN